MQSNMNIYKKSGLAAFMMLGALQLSAQDMNKDHDPTEKFVKIDADKSGQIDLEEMTAYKQEKWQAEGKEMTDDDMLKLEEKFGKIDTNQDGVVNLEEFSKAMKHKKKDWKKEKDMEREEDMESPE